MIRNYFRWALIVALAAQLAGCYGDYGPVVGEADPVLPPSHVAATIQPGEVIKVTIYGEEGLTGAYTVNPAGDISMPLVGTLRASGMTRNALEHEITRRYVAGKFLQDPKVTIDTTAYQPIYVLGEALRPGAYPYTAGLNVLTAVTLAGGFTYRASKTMALIQHAGETVWNEYPLAATTTVEPGDLIRVPERYF
jgi:protein involved in polysaccharide export with SLBB domain